jgi:glycerol-3-phosphate cytidylyltransferase
VALNAGKCGKWLTKRLGRESMKTVITYGTFDIFHVGHVRLLSRARELGDRLVVGVSSDEFNALKGKRSIFTYAERAEIVGSMRFVDSVFPEHGWDQKRTDMQKYDASVFVMGGDWEGKFDELKDDVEVVYLPRTPSVSTTEVKSSLRAFTSEQLNALNAAVDVVSAIVKDLA